MSVSRRKLPISSENAGLQMSSGSFQAPLRSMTASGMSPLRSQSPRNSPHPAFFQSTLTAKLTAKPVDNNGFPWMGVEIGSAWGAAGRHWWTLKDE